MALTPGSRIGSYEILAPLGAGGMGEVYRARDSKLGREVAIKVLPDAVEGDLERIARFEREAKSLAALNHPHIATLFGMERDGDRHFLVMELVAGDTLADRLRAGPFPVAEVLVIARQIADALEAAHERGIVHRDLKPANVKVTPDGSVKVLDFGLAKAVETGPGSPPQLSQSPTLSVVATSAGVILGTAPYMSPEQAKGMPADHRSDVFSFGAVLYELLTGKPAFTGESVADTLASVLAREPDWSALPPSLDSRVSRLLERCLAKSRRQRWQAIGDVRAEIEFMQAAPTDPLAAQSRPAAAFPVWTFAIAIASTAIVVSAIAAALAMRDRAPDAKPITRFSYPYPTGYEFGTLARHLVAVSPDGSNMAFSTHRGLAIRSMATGEMRILAEGIAMCPVFAPDGRSIAFHADGAIVRLPLGGGVPSRIAPIDALPVAMSWGDTGIVISAGTSVLRVAADGGPLETLIASDPAQNIGTAEILPGGTTLLFTKAGGADANDWDTAEILTKTLSTGAQKTVHRGGSNATYASTGHLMYVQGGVLFAVPFDRERLEVTGEPMAKIEGVLRSVTASGVAQFHLGADGTLAYVKGPVFRGSGQRELTMTELSGTVTKLPIAVAAFTTPRFSPDGKSLAFGIDDSTAAIWVYELAGASAIRRLTFEGRNRYPIWSADAKWIIYHSNRIGESGIYRQRADGTGASERVTATASGTQHTPESVTPDGRRLLYSVSDGKDVSLWSVDWGGAAPQRVGTMSSASAFNSQVSPDGRWLTYATRRGSMNSVVFVEPFPTTGAKYQVSRTSEDGHHPIWSPDGSRLYYIPAPGNLFAVGVTYGSTPIFSASSRVPRGFSIGNAPPDVRSHDLSHDGTRIVGLVRPGAGDPGSDSLAPTIEVVRNWIQELKSAP